MGKAKNFSEFTYGVGLEITAQSFKQVKDDLKLNLDNLSKMVKSYGKVLKIDPDADLSKLFDEMRKLQGIVDGINGSDNSFAGFVDKGTLGSIAALEDRLSSIDSASDKTQMQLEELKSVIKTLLDPLKQVGNIKFPATFENLFSNFEDQSSKIKDVVDSISILSNSITELKKTSESASGIWSNINITNKDLDTKRVEELSTKFFNLKNQLLNMSDLDATQAKNLVLQIQDIGIQLANAIKGFSNERLLDEFAIDETVVITEIDDLINSLQPRKDKLTSELAELKELQSKFVESKNVKSSSGKTSLGLQSDITAQVKVTPKANDTEWANTINDTIKNVEKLLKPVRLIPTFSKSKNIDKEIDSSVANINHAVDVEIKVNHNIEKFNDQINNIDQSIKNAKKRLEENGNFHIKFEYEEGGNFRDVAYKIINQLKKVEVHVDNQTSKNFLKELGDLRTAANKELKNIRATVKFNSFDSLMKSVDSLKAGIDSKLGKHDIVLGISNEPEIIAQATLIRDKLISLFGKVPVNLGVNTVTTDVNTNTPNNTVEQLSEAAQEAQQKLEKCRQTLESLQKLGFNSPHFLELGDITAQGKRAKDSTSKLEELLNKYKELKAKLPDDVAVRWQELYPEANGDKTAAAKMAKQAQIELKKVEAELNTYVQKQIAYTQSRYDANQKILQQEKEIASTQGSGVDKTVKSVDSEKIKKVKNEIVSINKLIKDLQTNGFSSSEFLNLGDIGADGKKIEESTKKIKRLLTEYNNIKKRITKDKGAGSNQWLEKYPKANGDMNKARTLIEKDEKRMQKIKSELNQYLQKQIAFLSSRQSALQQTLSTEEQITSENAKQAQVNKSDVGTVSMNQQLAMSAEEASKKVKSLNGKLTQQKKVLKDLEENGINAASFIKLGEWDKETGSFKKNKEEIQQLVNKYNELKAAREKAGGKKAVGEEASLRGKLSAILRQQKQHVSEIVAQNQAELKTTKDIVAEHKKTSVSGKTVSTAKTNADIETLEKNIEQLTDKLNKARSALSSLKSDGITAVGSTGLKDTKGVLKNAGITQGLKQTVELYNQLLAKKKELESGSGVSQSVGRLNKQIEDLVNARQILEKKGFLGLTDTKLGDVKSRLGEDPEALNNLISQYRQLLTAKKEFEKSGDTTSDNYIQISQALEGATQQLKILRQDQMNEIDSKVQILQAEISKQSEYAKVVQECKNIEELLADVHKNQVDYATKKAELYSKQLTDAQELLKVEQQRAQTLDKQADKKSNVDKVAPTTTSTKAASNVVQLDSATLGSLAKDDTLRSIDGKVGNILSQLGSGLNITGSNISINASNVSVAGGTAAPVNTSQNAGTSSIPDANGQIASGAKQAVKEQKELNSELTVTHENVKNLSNAVKVVNARTGEVKKEVETYKTADKVSEKVETSGWVSHGKNEPATYEHVSTVYKTNMEAFNKLKQDFINALAKQKQIEQQIAATNGPTSKLQAELDAQKDITLNLEAQLKAHEELYTQEVQRAALAEATKKAQQEMTIKQGAQSDKDINKQNTELTKIVDVVQKKYDDMQRTMSNFKLPMADPVISKFKEYEQLLSQLKIKQQEINVNPDLLKDENYSKNFDSLIQKINSVHSEFISLQKSSEGFLSKIKSLDDVKILGSTFDPNNLEQMHDAMYQFVNQVSFGKAKLIEFNDAERTATFEIKNAKGQVQQITVEYDAATNSLGRYTNKTKESVSETRKFIDSLKHSFKNVARYLASFGSIYRLFAVIKQGFTYIKDINSALTELKKVTDETDASYENFLQNMSKTGKVVGATVKDLTIMSAEWARLGYSMEEAGKLAKSTAILLNVSEFDDATKASEALISTMQAFKYTADESGHVVDILNEVGNNYAVSSDGIATALQDSASALMEGGNNLEQAVALVAAANRVVQDPNSVGSALRTISLRLRGTSVEVLEEMGEETDNVVESTSKLQEKIKALSGVDILTDAGEYKDTYTILSEIGQVWEQMSDIDQAALLELMAGKNRANTLSAILSNMKDLKNAYESALNAEGSALKENEAYLDSIQGRVDLFNNSVQTMWMNAINSETVKGFVDLGTKLIDIIDKFGLIRTLITGIFTYITTFSKNKIDFASILGIHDLESGWFHKKIKIPKNQNIVNTVLGNPNDIKVSVEDFASAIQDNVDRYVNIDTKQLDSEIESIQNKLMISRQHLEVARSKDWNYYKSLGSIQPAKDRDLRIEEQRQQIKILEEDLTRLQNKRQEIVSNAVNNTASSMVSSIEKEKTAYQSMLSVLSQVRDTKLYLGNEQDAAAKIDAMSAAAQKGQVSLTNYVSSLGDADIALKAYAASVEDGNYSLAGFQKFIAQHNAGLKATGAAARVAAIGHQILNTALSMGISLLVSGFISLIMKAANAQKEAAESAREAAKASEALRKQNESLKDYKDQINELRTELDSNTLSEQEAYDARKKLLTIQNELIDKFGLEKDGINLITGAIEEQIGAIDRLAQAEAKQWMQNKQKSINDALEYFNSDIKGGQLDPWYEGFGTRIDMWGQAQNVIDMIDEYASTHDHIFAEDGALIPGDQSIGFTGSVEEVKTAVEDFQNWLGTKENEMQTELNGLLEIDNPDNETQNRINSLKEDLKQLQDVREDIGAEHENWFGMDSAYAANKAIMEELQYNTAITQYDKQYGNILAAQDALNQALAKGDDEASKNAISDIRSNIESASQLAAKNGQQYMVDYFNTFLDGLSEQEFELNIKTNENRLKDQLSNIIKESGELGLSALDNNQIQDLARKYEDGQFNVIPGVGDASGTYTQSQINGIAALKTQADAAGISVESLIDILTQFGIIMGRPVDSVGAVKTVDTYSVLASEAESYNEILFKTSEIISDNTEVTQEYKDSLTAMGISSKELADCFDENNGLIVKNAALLNKLVKQKKQDKQATVQQAKSYGQLQYKTTINQIGQLVNRMATEIKATGYVSAATLDNISVLREQLDVIKQTIQQYALLELSLSDAAQAYSDFEAAKERDAQLAYGDSMVEALNVLNEGFKTGQVGSEAFQYAVKLIVPPEVYENIDDVQERMQAIHDYVDKNPIFADYFTIDEGQISITIDNIKAFLQDGLDDGLGANFGTFIGTIEDFDLAPHIQSVKDLADAYGITEAAALAMLTEFEKYDASWGDIIARLTTTELDRNINDATDALEEAITAQEEFIKSGQPLYDENGEMTAGYKAVVDAVNNARGSLDDATQAAINNAQTYTQVEAILKGMSGEMKYTQEQADALARSLGLINENGHITINAETGALVLTNEQVDILNQKLTGLKEPTVLDIQLASDQIDQQIQELQKKLKGEAYDEKVLVGIEAEGEEEIQAKIDELTATQEVIKLVYDITPSGDQNDSNLEKLGNWEANGVNITVRADTTEFDADIEKVNAAETPGKEVAITTTAEEANDEINTVTNNNPPDKNVNVYMQGVSTALDEINSISDALDSLSGTSYHTIAIQYANQNGGIHNVDGNFNISGGAFANGTVGAPKTETSLVGELGPELIVDPSTGRWHTVGDHGAEFTQVKRGQIIFNHLQTKQLLENGYVTSRGRLQGGNPAFASGTAYGFGIFDSYVGDGDAFKNGSDKWVNPGENAWSDVADDLSDAADDAEQTLDFIEIKLEEIEAIIEKTSTRISNFLDDTTSINSKDELYDELIKAEKDKADVYLKAAQKYDVQAAAALSGVPQQYQAMARNGAIAIEEFLGEDQVEIAEKIQEYRDWAAKADEAENGHLEAIAAISAHRVEQLEDIATDFENIVSISKSHSDLLQAEMDFIEESGNRLSESYYEELKKHSQKQLNDMQNERVALQKILDDSVAAGDVLIGSDDWYSMLETIYEVDQEIIDCKTSLEEFQNAINDLYWDNFDKLITEIDNVNSELSNLYDLVSDTDDVVDEMGNWTDDGITALGLLVQQMENAQFKSEEYGKAIAKLKKDYAEGLYSTDEYNEKLSELTDSQYDAIKSYEDAKDAIVDLNKTRVEAVKDGLQKEIDAYSELIEKKKEALNAEKDAYDFQKQVQESDKNIKDIERKIAALEGNTSSSAMAQRKRLEADLLKAKEEQQDIYYNHSIEKQQEALDKELDDYTQNKQDQMDALDEYLKKEEQVIADSFDLIAENTKSVIDTLIGISEEYGVTISDTIATPWIDGANAIGTYEERLDTSVSATTANLETLKAHLADLQVQADKTAESVVAATHSTIVETNDGHQTSIKGYAKGSKGVEYDQWALIDELGDELQLVPNAAGRLDYIKKGTGILNNTLTERLMNLAMDPTSMIENSRPVIGTPGIATTNNTIQIDASVGTLLHVEHLDGSNPAEVSKLIDKAWEKKMQTLNNSIKKFTR